MTRQAGGARPDRGGGARAAGARRVPAARDRGRRRAPRGSPRPPERSPQHRPLPLRGLERAGRDRPTRSCSRWRSPGSPRARRSASSVTISRCRCASRMGSVLDDVLRQSIEDLLHDVAARRGRAHPPDGGSVRGSDTGRVLRMRGEHRSPRGARPAEQELENDLLTAELDRRKAKIKANDFSGATTTEPFVLS